MTPGCKIPERLQAACEAALRQPYVEFKVRIPAYPYPDEWTYEECLRECARLRGVTLQEDSEQVLQED